MSSEALAWAFKQQGLQSAVKFTLVALCECANYATGEIFPSIAHICEITAQNRKTVITNIGKLEAAGLVVDTGRRVGATKQIKVYQAAVGTVPKAEQSQKRNGSTFGGKQSQKRDTEPSREPSRYIYRDSAPEFENLPGWIPGEAWADFLNMRAGLGLQPLGGAALEYLISDLAELRDAGNDPKSVICQSTVNEWKAFFPLKSNKGRVENERVKDGSRTGGGIARALAITGGANAARRASGSMGSLATDGSRNGNLRIRTLPNALRAAGDE